MNITESRNESPQQEGVMEGVSDLNNLYSFREAVLSASKGF